MTVRELITTLAAMNPDAVVVMFNGNDAIRTLADVSGDCLGRVIGPVTSGDQFTANASIKEPVVWLNAE